MTRYCIGQCRTVGVVVPSQFGDIDVEAMVRLKARPHSCTNGTWFDGGDPAIAPEFEVISMEPEPTEAFRPKVVEKLLEAAARHVDLWEYDADHDS